MQIIRKHQKKLIKTCTKINTFNILRIMILVEYQCIKKADGVKCF